MIVLSVVFAASWFVATAMAAHLPRLAGSTRRNACGGCHSRRSGRPGAGWRTANRVQRFAPRVAAGLGPTGDGLHPIGAALLAIIGAPAAVLFTLLHGGGNGMLTIARGTLPLALFGAAGYGLRTGLLAAPARILQGGAPLLFSLVLDHGGPNYALLLSGTLTGAAFVALLFVHGPRSS